MRNENEKNNCDCTKIIVISKDNIWLLFGIWPYFLNIRYTAMIFKYSVFGQIVHTVRDECSRRIFKIL